MNTTKEIAIRFAKENRFDTAIRSGKKWDGQLLYVALFKPGPEGNPRCTGYPQFIIIENSIPRFATPEEIEKIMGFSSQPIGFTERFEDYL